MRGKVRLPAFPKKKARITPAYAGKRSDLCRLSEASEDHPRLCGEKVFPEVQPIQISGSPPPMRGKARYSVALIGK